MGCDTYLPLFRNPIPESGSPIENLAEWVWETPYNFPTQERVRATLPFIRRRRAECVIINNTTGCRYFGEASTLAKDLIERNWASLCLP